ncbi:MAG: hypothetical protein ABJD97_24755, partial [Betaproteobacteria bacterium]
TRGRGPREALLLDIDTGRSRPAGVPASTRGHGTLAIVDGQAFALYADAGVLWFQWNEQRWPFASDDLCLAYGHDLATATTTFGANDRTIAYAAWWRDDPAFDARVPEQDAQQDYLAYVVATQRDPVLQQSLLAAWQSAG